MTVLITRVTGSIYHVGASTKMNSLRPGVRLQLRRDRSNRFDRRAVEILSDGVVLGYVRSRDNHGIAAVLDTGGSYIARFLGNYDVEVKLP